LGRRETSSMSQQPPYNPPPWEQQHTPYQQPPPWHDQPTQINPGQFQPPLSQSFPLPRKQTGLGEWFKSRTRRTKIGLGCGALIAVLVLCSCVTAAFGSGVSPSTTTATPSPTSQSQVAQIIPTDTPIPMATTLPSPTPTPTQKPTPTPTPRPTQTPKPTQPPIKPTPTPTRCQGVNNNPWCYDFSPGKYIYYPPTSFCSYFNCIASFWGADDPGDGYVVQCQDSTYSQSGSEQGACSSHGGVSRPLYSH
jgi:hypothetical protein